MFKYLPITSTLHEMMIMLNSLPTCTVVLDRDCNVVEINQLALEFLNIKAKCDYKLRRIGVINDLEYIKNILKKLATGRDIRDKSHFVICAGGQSKVVNFSACMIEGTTKMFIFQFYEVAIFPSLFTEFQNAHAEQSIQKSYLIDKKKGHRSVKRLFEDRGRNTAYRFYLQECTIQFFARKYSGLTNDEVLVCTLIAFNLSVNEISVITNKLGTNIRASIYRIMKKFNVQTQEDLYDRLILELPYSLD
jgi:hypothetical protein